MSPFEHGMPWSLVKEADLLGPWVVERGEPEFEPRFVHPSLRLQTNASRCNNSDVLAIALANFSSLLFY